MNQTEPPTEPSNGTATFDRLAAPYDRGMAPLEKLALRQMRAQIVPYARGKVLEIGVGTGANIPFYAPSICLTAIDESPDMLAVAARRTAALDNCVHLSQMDVETLALPSNYFDTGHRLRIEVSRPPGVSIRMTSNSAPSSSDWSMASVINLEATGLITPLISMTFTCFPPL